MSGPPDRPSENDRPRPRILIEHHDVAVALATANLLEDEGYEVSTCTGPNVRHQCSLVGGDPCLRAVEADVVIFGLEVEDADDRAVLESLKATMLKTPIIVEIPPRREPLYRKELEGCITVPRPMTREALLDAVVAALR